MPIRFFCEHCRQMLKIGTSKMGSVVNCPRCQKAVVVPLNSTPQAEQLYQMLKKKRLAVAAAPPPEEEIVSEPSVPKSAWEDLGSNVNEDDLNLWIDEFWKKTDSRPQALPSIPVIAAPVVTGEVAIVALQKRYKLTLTLLYVSATVAFLVGTVFGIFIRGLYFPPGTQPAPSASMAGQSTEANVITGTLFYLTEYGERRPDVEAVIIGLPKDSPPSPLFSCQGLRPGAVLNNDTVQQIREKGGMYGSADVNGAFTLQYQKGVRYFVIIISAHQIQADGIIPQGILQELRRYFQDPGQFAGNALYVIDEFTGTGGTHHFVPHVFEFARTTEPDF